MILTFLLILSNPGTRALCLGRSDNLMGSGAVADLDSYSDGMFSISPA